jgi:ACS family hexuronate transporter-like MFS transporter
MPKNTISSVVGLGGFVGSMMGGVVAALTGWIVQTTGSYVPVFAGISSVYLVALLLVHILVPRIGQSNKA